MKPAMEGVDTSFAVRNFGYDYGQFYKPEDGTVDILKLLNISTETVALQ